MNAVLRYHERNEAKVIPSMNEKRFTVSGEISKRLVMARFGIAS